MEVYLDNSATTMCYPEVGELVYHIMCRDYGNPSAMYRKGMEAERYIKEAKETISKLLKVNAKEIIFTSGGTESDNQALIGCARANRRNGNHLITSCVEHPAILNTMQGNVSGNIKFMVPKAEEDKIIEQINIIARRCSDLGITTETRVFKGQS